MSPPGRQIASPARLMSAGHQLESPADWPSKASQSDKRNYLLAISREILPIHSSRYFIAIARNYKEFGSQEFEGGGLDEMRT